jgi:N-acetylmuramic acid 6-phosphate etherase
MSEVPTTERANPATAKIDRMTPLEIVRLINREDAKVAEAVAEAEREIALAIEKIAERFRRGGRLIYVGAGTAGRMGVLDASECPPTFRTDPAMVVGVIAGGDSALRNAIEGAEDNREAGIAAMKDLGVSDADTVCGISASGGAPYVVAAVEYARSVGAMTVAVTCNPDPPLARAAEIAIKTIVGPEVIAGSTRMKAGTAQKMVLNMLTTGAMIQMGKIYGNLMVDLNPTNQKLVKRARRIVCEVCGVDEETAESALGAAGWHVKTAIVMLKRGVNAEAAHNLLEDAGGRIAVALGEV